MFAQGTTTFIRLPGTVGYVLDSTENRQAHLIKFIPENSTPMIRFKKYDWSLYLDNYKN